MAVAINGKLIFFNNKFKEYSDIMQKTFHSG